MYSCSDSRTLIKSIEIADETHVMVYKYRNFGDQQASYYYSMTEKDKVIIQPTYFDFNEKEKLSIKEVAQKGKLPLIVILAENTNIPIVICDLDTYESYPYSEPNEPIEELHRKKQKLFDLYYELERRKGQRP